MQSFETPGFYMLNVKSQKLLSADQSLPQKHILLTRKSLCCCL